MTSAANLTKTQMATLARIVELSTSAPLDVTYGGIKGVNRTSLWSLEEMGLVIIERITTDGRLTMFASARGA